MKIYTIFFFSCKILKDVMTDWGFTTKSFFGSFIISQKRQKLTSLYLFFFDIRVTERRSLVLHFPRSAIGKQQWWQNHK